MEYEKIVLKNGVRVILVEKPDFLSFTMLCLFGTGSRNENEKNAGVSHFLEHMMYKGAKKRKTPMEVAQFVDSMGAEHNAFTGKEYTGYYVKAAADKILPAIDFLADNVVGAMIPEEEVLKERGVIVEEIKMYEDIPSAKMEEEFEKIMFPGDVLGRPIAGEAKIIEKMTRDDIVGYKENNYSADNCVISICGNFLNISREKLIEELEKNFRLKSGMPRESMQSNLVNSVAVKTISKPIEQSNICIGFLGCSDVDPDYYPLKLLAKILGGSMSSRMFTEVREKRGLCYRIKTATESYFDTGLIATVAGVANEKVSEALIAILDEYRKIKEEGVSEEELLRAKEIFKGSFLIDMEDSEELAHIYAFSEMFLGKPVGPMEEVEKFMAVTKEEVLRVAKKYIDFSKSVFSGVGPNLNEVEIKKILDN